MEIYGDIQGYTRIHRDMRRYTGIYEDIHRYYGMRLMPTGHSC